MTDDPIDQLASLRSTPPGFDLASSLDRAERRSRTARIRRMAGLCLLITGAAAVGYLALPPSTPSVDRPVVSAPALSPSAPQRTAPTSSPFVASPPEPRAPRGASLRSTPQPAAAARPLTPINLTPDLARRLDLDLRVMREIKRLLGSSDRVVLVENTTDRETCLQITCEGGDARSIVCSAPSPSPRFVTDPTGRLLYAIEREGASHSVDRLVPMSVPMDGEPVLVWYDDVPSVRARIQMPVVPTPMDDHIAIDLRPDASVVFTVPNVGAGGDGLSLVDLSGAPVSATVRGHRTDDGGVELAIHGIRPGLYDLRLGASASTSTRRVLVIIR